MKFSFIARPKIILILKTSCFLGLFSIFYLSIAIHSYYEISFYDGLSQTIDYDYTISRSVDEVKNNMIDNGLYYKFERKISLYSPKYFVENLYYSYVSVNYKWSNDLSFSLKKQYLYSAQLGGEVPSKWRAYFQGYYREIIQSLQNQKNVSRTNAARRLLKDLDTWFKHSAITLNAPYPGFDELMNYKEGDCYYTAFISSMLLRSHGIPATVDYCPFWGYKDGGHAEVVVYSDNARFESNIHTSHKEALRGAPKVYRLVRSLSPYLINQGNLHTDLQFLQDDCFEDVTSEHTETMNVLLRSSDPLIDIIYACVSSGSRWRPITFAKRDNKQDYLFKDLGKGHTYRLAYFDGVRLKFLNQTLCI